MQTQTLTATGRLVRVLATVVASTLLLAGTIWGTDDHFPFGPFSMYAGINGPNDPAPDTRVEATDATGRVVVIDGARHAAHHTHPEDVIEAVFGAIGRADVRD